MNAILLVSHGSRSAQAQKEIDALVQQLEERSSAPIVKSAFLQIGSPDVCRGVEDCIRQGATEITILLNFLHSGRHTAEEIPAMIKQIKKTHHRIKFNVTKPIGQHKHLADLFLKLIDG